VICKGRVNDVLFIPAAKDEIEIRVNQPNGDYSCAYLSNEDADRLVDYIMDLKRARKLVREEGA
jgi:hypothetical protein